MKTLIIIRHAKSSWGEDSLPDSERPLGKRGKRDAPEMGKRLAKRNISPDLIVSSPAARAIGTARLIADEIGYPKKNIHPAPRLYAAGVEDWFAVIHDLDDGTTCVALVGHNPAVEELLEFLAPRLTDRVPTCAIAILEAAIDHWSALTPKTIRTTDFDYPKRTR